MTVSGVTQGMDLVLRSLLRPGDTVLVEDPAWFLVFGLLRALGVQVLAVPRLRDGPMWTVCSAWPPRTGPSCSSPTPWYTTPRGFGLSLPVAYDVLRLAEQHNFSDPGGRHLCRFRPPAAHAAGHAGPLAQGGCWWGGFSKTLAGSLRVGYIAAQPQRIAPDRRQTAQRPDQPRAGRARGPPHPGPRASTASTCSACASARTPPASAA